MVSVLVTQDHFLESHREIEIVPLGFFDFSGGPYPSRFLAAFSRARRIHSTVKPGGKRVLSG
jgi:hypothetical protein